jgi:hypothetical protein
MADLKRTLVVLGFVALSFFGPARALAWGRHDLITEIAVAPAMSGRANPLIAAEPIEKAAPDLLRRVMPGLLQWCLRYHREHDPRYSWSIPDLGLMARSERRAGRPFDDREALLWLLEDNIRTPLALGANQSAAEILVQYVDEPDGPLDDGLDQALYLERVRPSMSYFYEPGNPHTHAFRHCYVPASWVPPILGPKGVAPYRAALYAKLSEGAFQTGHPYWGYRFLAWSIHYVQDMTQPWHTVFVPGFSFLRFSKARMRHEIASLHYLTEAFVDTWLLEQVKTLESEPLRPSRALASSPSDSTGKPKPPQSEWAVAELAEHLADQAHEKAGEIAALAREFFAPIVAVLGPDLKPTIRGLQWGKLTFDIAKLDFDGNGSAATEAIAPLWSPAFGQTEARERLLALLIPQIDSAVEGSRQVIAETLEKRRKLL